MVERSSEIFSKRPDFTVVGASFAGSLLASKLARHGRVLLMDRREPGTRLKCGGGVRAREFDSLQLDIPNVRVSKIMMARKGRKTICFRTGYVAVDRRELDAAMFKRAVESGAIFQKAEYLSHVPADRIVKARIDGEADDFKYRKLILANGFNPDTGGYFYGSSYVEIVESGSRHEDALYFSLLEKTPGCCWIFPLPGGRVNIGIGSLSGSPFSMDDFRRFKDEQGISGNLICRGGGMIPLVPARKVMDGDVCRFGDAAGMVFSANGEGIRNMIKMGDLWTDCIVNGGKLNARWTANRTFIRLLASTAVVKMIAASGAFGSRIYNCLSRAAARARSFMR